MRFYRQKVIGPFIPDFVCERAKLIVEIDGPVHDEQVEQDRERQAYLESRGYALLRVSADSAEHQLDEVVTRIVDALNARADPSKSPAPEASRLAALSPDERPPPSTTKKAKNVAGG